MSIVIPGQPTLDMADIQRQEAMQRAMIQRTIIEAGSQIFANLAAAYYASLPEGGKIDPAKIRQYAMVGKELGMFYAEAHGMVSLQVQDGKTE